MKANERRNSTMTDLGARTGTMAVGDDEPTTTARSALRAFPRVRPAEATGSRRAEIAPMLLAQAGLGAGPVVTASVPCVIGRSAGTDLTLNDVGVSRWHARVERHAAGFFVQDLGSCNGTFVNGERVQVASLKDGDVIRVGHVEIVFHAARRSA